MNTRRYIGAVGMCAVALTWSVNGWAASPRSHSMESGAPDTKIRKFIPAGEMGLPPGGQVGKCYARVWVDAEYGTETDRLLAREGADRIEVDPARFEMKEERVLVREAYDRMEVIPAQYKTVTEQIMIKPAYATWQQGRGPVEKVNNATGEIMCLVEVPAEYKTVTKRVLVESATIQRVHVPAEYKTYKVQTVAKPAEGNHVPIAADYQSVTRTVLLKDGHMAWQEIECDNRASVKTEAFRQPAAKAVEPAVEVKPQPKPVVWQPIDNDDWFFLWKYDELFDDGQWEIAHRK